MTGLAAAAVLAGIAIGGGAAESEERKVESMPPLVDVIDSYAARLQVGPPRRHRGLTLFPVFAEGAAAPRAGLTLDEAMERGLLQIRELRSAEVNRVRLLSKADEAIFVMGGEMLGGAKQDRIVGDDLIVRPGADLIVPVFCVEHGRWVAKSDSFTSGRMLAASEVRKARMAADQSAVWQRVGAAQERLNAPSATGAMRSIAESEEVQSKTRPYLRDLSDFVKEAPRAHGVVVCVGREIIAADLFGSRLLFRKLWPKLLDSYVIDAVERDAHGAAPDAVQIRRWLDGVRRARRVEEDTPGAGDLYQLRGDSVIGSALVYDAGLVHMELFRDHSVRPLQFNRLQFRRERLEGEDQPTPRLAVPRDR
jgi:hypothetical protein